MRARDRVGVLEVARVGIDDREVGSSTTKRRELGPGPEAGCDLVGVFGIFVKWFLVKFDQSE